MADISKLEEHKTVMQVTTRDMSKASGDSALARESSDRIRAFRTKYEQIAKITGISEEPKRMSVTK